MRALSKLDFHELRVLGVLLEKEQTTPDYYPMTLKGIVAACNQKTNREPVLALTESQVLNVLRVLEQDGLVGRESGARAERWHHRLQGPFLRPDSRALLTLLILRGAQTPGELRLRSERMYPFSDPAAVERSLLELADADPPLVVRLPRTPGQKESRWSLCQDSRKAEDPSRATLPAAAPQTSLLESLQRLEELLRQAAEEIRNLKAHLE